MCGCCIKVGDAAVIITTARRQIIIASSMSDGNIDIDTSLQYSLQAIAMGPKSICSNIEDDMATGMVRSVGHWGGVRSFLTNFRRISRKLTNSRHVAY